MFASGSYLSGAGGPVSRDRHAALIRIRVGGDSDIKPIVAIVNRADRSPDFDVAVTGEHTVGNDFSTLSQRDLEHGELFFGLPAALVVLILVFGAVVAGLVPVLMALLSIVVGLGIVAILSLEFTLSVFIVNMLSGMGLALGIDYSLFVISRYREERTAGHVKEQAIGAPARRRAARCCSAAPRSSRRSSGCCSCRRTSCAASPWARSSSASSRSRPR